MIFRYDCWFLSLKIKRKRLVKYLVVFRIFSGQNWKDLQGSLSLFDYFIDEENYFYENEGYIVILLNSGSFKLEYEYRDICCVFFFL